MSDNVASAHGSVFTNEEGTISGDLELSLAQGGKLSCRYAGNDSWYTVPGDHGSRSLQDICEEINSGRRDQDGNKVPFPN